MRGKGSSSRNWQRLVPFSILCRTPVAGQLNVWLCHISNPTATAGKADSRFLDPKLPCPLHDTVFADPTGLNYNNKSTALEVIKLLQRALAKDDIARATSTSTYQYEVQGKEKKRLVTVKNTDWLVNSYLDIVGGKTGHLEKAGWCLAVKIKGEENQEILVVVLDSETNFDRFQDVKAISDFVFTNYKW